MIQSLYTSEAGVMGMQLGIDVLADNIANINTVGFKKSEVTFKEMLQMNYNVPQENINPMQKGLGVWGKDIRKLMTQGTFQSTNNVTDVSINGDGYFILNNNKNETLYSRAGSFRFDSGKTSTTDGLPTIDDNGVVYYLGTPTLTTPMKLVNQYDGAIVQGYLADANDTISTSGTPTDFVLENDDFVMPAAATTSAKIGYNIDESADITNFNSTTIKSLKIGDSDINLDNVDSKLALYGNALNTKKGEYTVILNTDGSAKVSFLKDGLSDPQDTYYNAGTISTSLDDTSKKLTIDKLSEIIPGLKISLKQDLTEPVTLKFNNSGETIGEQYSAIDTVYDSNGDTHNLAVKFSKIGTNEWQWETELYNLENFKGTGNAQTLALSDDIDLNRDITITATNLSTGVTRTISPNQYSIFEGNKICTNEVFDNNEVIKVNYTTKYSNQSASESFSYPERAQTFLLDKAPDPDSVRIYIDGNTTPLKPDFYQVSGNKILPIDADGDGKNDAPYIGSDVDVRVEYVISDLKQSAEYSCKDSFDGNGLAQSFPLSQVPDEDKTMTFTVTDINGNTKRTLTADDFTLNGNLYENTYSESFSGTGAVQTFTLSKAKAADSNPTYTVQDSKGNTLRTLSRNNFTINSDGTITNNSSSLIGANENLVIQYTPKDTLSNIIADDEKLIVEYTPKDENINMDETFTSDGTASTITLKGQPEADSITIKVKNSNGDIKTIDSSAYELGGDKIYFKDTDSDGIPNSIASSGDEIQINYNLNQGVKNKISFDKNGNLSGGTPTTKVSFDIATADPLKINLDFTQLKQLASSYSDVGFADINGNQEGYLTNLGIDDTGKMSGYYSNSITKDIGQLALATFNNPGGLYSAGNSYYQDSPNTGGAVIGTGGKDTKFGTIQSKSLEMSNVDLGEEFSNLIVLQRSFQLNSKGITTSDEMIQQALATKRY